MKILHVNAVSDIGSTGRLVRELADGLDELGHESHIAYSQGDSTFHNSYKFGTKLEQKIHAFLSRILGLQGYFSYIGTLSLIKRMKKIQPDVVHLHNLHSNNISLHLLMKYIERVNTPVVITLHDCWFYTGKCCHYTKIKCSKWKNKCERCPQIKSYNKSYFFDRTDKMYLDKKKYFNRLDNLAVIGVSKWITEEAKQSILSNAKVIDYVYNWINFDIFYPRKVDEMKKELNIKDKYVILGVSALWDEDKGIKDFIELSKVLDKDSIIILIGEIPKNITLTNNIINIKRTNNADELAKYYSIADIFINLSKQETFGLVTAEALSCGTPVVVYNTTACPELVEDSCGLIAKLEDIEDLYENIMKIKKIGKTAISKQCISYAHSNFSYMTNIKQYEDVYKEILE